MVLDMFVFMFLAMRYKYVQHMDDAETPRPPPTTSASAATIETNYSDPPSYPEETDYKQSPSKITREAIARGITNEAYVFMDEK